MRGNTAIDNTADILDSRDIIARIAYLESERDAGIRMGTTPEEDAASVSKWAEENPEDAEELAALLTLQEEAEGYAPDWTYGATLVRRSHFVDYAQEFAEDIGAVKSETSWPYTCIDWDEAARELEQDYTSVDFAGVEYLVR